MESERGDNIVGFQGGNQIFNTDNILINNGQSKFDRDVSEEFLSSTAFPTMCQRRDNVSNPHTDTCRWMLGLKKYQNWINAPRGLLWIKGKPGAGKSTLMAFLYQHIMEHEAVGIALEFFFNARGEELQHTPLGMLRSLLNQLYRQDPHIRPGLDAIYLDKCDAFGEQSRSWDWQQPDLERIFHENIIAAAQRQPLTIFVDALDETGSENAQHLANYFHRLSESIAEKSACGRICISCRHYPIFTTRHAVEITVEDHNHDDITAYVHHHLRLDLLLPTDSPDYSSWSSVIESLISLSNGVFQWVSIVVPLVEKRILDGQSPQGTRKFLKTVPKELGDVYEYILRNVIEVQNHSRAYLLFLWVCLAERPLSVTEMRYAISIRDTTNSSPRTRCDATFNFPKDDTQMERQIKAFSGGLIEVVKVGRRSSKKMVQVVHQSVNDYILPKGLILLAGLDDQGQGSFPCQTRELGRENLMQCCQSLMYYSCFTYSRTENIESYNENDTSGMKMAYDNWPFLEYTNKHMVVHATKAGEYSSRGLEKETQVFEQLFPKCLAINSDRLLPYTLSTMLLFIASKGLSDIIVYLLSNGVPVDEKNGDGDTALHHAAIHGNATAARILLDVGADIHTKNIRGETPVTNAATSGHKETMEIFLSKGSDVGMFGDSLHKASLYGKEEIVQMLLNAGADVNAVSGEYATALQAASYGGSGEIVQLLLKAGADVNSMGGQYGTALQAASIRGDEEIVQLLLKAGADIDVVSGVHGTALTTAAQRPWNPTELVRSLLSHGADPSIPDQNGQTLAHTAARRGLRDIVILIGPDNALFSDVDCFNRTPLHLAVYYGHREVAASLAECLHQLPGKDIYGKTPLDWASQDPVMLENLRQRWPMYTSTSNETQISVLRQSVLRLVENLPRTTDGWSTSGLFELGRCLMFLDMPDDAMAVFTKMTYRLNSSGFPQIYDYCNACGGNLGIGSRYICEICAEVTLCYWCKEEYSPRGDVLWTCQDHTFMRIPFARQTELTSITSDDFQERLRGLRGRLGGQNSKKAVHGNASTTVEDHIVTNTHRSVLGYNIAVAIVLGSSLYLVINSMGHRQGK